MRWELASRSFALTRSHDVEGDQGCAFEARAPKFAREAVSMAAEGEICVDEVWDRMGKKLEHMLSSFADNDVTHLDAPEWMRMYT